MISTFEFWDFVKFRSGAANKVRTSLLLLCFLLLASMDGWMCFFFFLVPLVCVEVCGVQAFGN